MQTETSSRGAVFGARSLRAATRWGWIAFPLLLLYVITSDDAYLQYASALMIIYALSAIGLDWLMGRAGVVSLGNGALMGVGAFSAAIISRQEWSSFLLTPAHAGWVCLCCRSRSYLAQDYRS